MGTEEKTVTVNLEEAFIIKTDPGELCRLCANTDNQLIPIFRGEGLEHNLSHKIDKHLPIIKVTEVDKLPLQICYQCASTLISWHNLYEGCRVADKKLREILSIDEKSCLEDEAYDDYADDYRESFNDDTQETLPTSISNTSDLESNTLKDNPTEVRTLKVDKPFNETDLDESNERYLRRSDCESGDDDENCINDEHIKDYGYEYYYNDNDDRLTKVARRSTSEKPLVKLQRQQRKRRRRNANIPGTRKRPALSSEITKNYNNNDKQIAAFAIELCGCVMSLNRCEICAKLDRFKCYYCPMVFLKVSERNHHLRISHRDELLRDSFELFCIFGQKEKEYDEEEEEEEEVFDERVSVVVDSPIESAQYECNECADKFIDKITLLKHLKNYHEFIKVPVPEENCSLRPVTVATIADELAAKGGKTYECAHCSEIFNSKVRIRGHLGVIHGFSLLQKPDEVTSRAAKKREAALMIKLANKSFKRSNTTVSQMPSSIATDTTLAPGYYICAVCGQIFLKRHSFTRHVNQHSASHYDCDKCKKSFTTRGALLKHQNVKHKDLPKNMFFLNGRKYLKCEQCSFTCRNERNKMEEHLRVHTGEKPFTCELCGKQFRTKALLRVHTRYVHEGIKEHACDICGRCFSNKRYMEEHRRIHTGEKPLICDLCGKTFRQNSSLTKHVENHLGIKKHGCHLCQKRFSNSHHLSIHIKRHMGVTNYVCDQCGKGFVDQYQLKNHKVVHSEERPFSCVLCGTSFKLLKHLKQHGKTHRSG